MYSSTRSTIGGVSILIYSIVPVPRYLPGIDTAVYNVMYSSSDIDNYRIIIIDIAIVLEYSSTRVLEYNINTMVSLLGRPLATADQLQVVLVWGDIFYEDTHPWTGETMTGQ